MNGMIKLQKLLCRPSLIFSLTSKLFTRTRPLLAALSARAVSVLVSTLDSRIHTTLDNMAPAIPNGPVEPSGTSSRGAQSSKLHSKVVRFSLIIFSLSFILASMVRDRTVCAHSHLASGYYWLRPRRTYCCNLPCPCKFKSCPV